MEAGLTCVELGCTWRAFGQLCRLISPPIVPQTMGLVCPICFQTLCAWKTAACTSWWLRLATQADCTSMQMDPSGAEGGVAVGPRWMNSSHRSSELAKAGSPRAAMECDWLSCEWNRKVVLGVGQEFVEWGLAEWAESLSAG